MPSGWAFSIILDREIQSMSETSQFGELTHLIESLAHTVEALTEEVRLLRTENTPQPEIPERISGAKVAEILGVRPSTIRKNWASYGLVRVGRASHGRYLFSKESVIRHIKERENGNY